MAMASMLHHEHEALQKQPDWPVPSSSAPPGKRNVRASLRVSSAVFSLIEAPDQTNDHQNNSFDTHNRFSISSLFSSTDKMASPFSSGEKIALPWEWKEALG